MSGELPGNMDPPPLAPVALPTGIAVEGFAVVVGSLRTGRIGATRRTLICGASDGALMPKVR